MRTDSVPHNIWTVDADLVRKYNGWRLFGSRISAGATLISGFAIVCVVLGWKNAEIISSAIGSILIGLGALLGFWYQQKIFVWLFRFCWRCCHLRNCYVLCFLWLERNGHVFDTR